MHQESRKFLTSRQADDNEASAWVRSWMLWRPRRDDGRVNYIPYYIVRAGVG